TTARDQPKRIDGSYRDQQNQFVTRMPPPPSARTRLRGPRLRAWRRRTFAVGTRLLRSGNALAYADNTRASARSGRASASRFELCDDPRACSSDRRRAEKNLDGNEPRTWTG